MCSFIISSNLQQKRIGITTFAYIKSNVRVFNKVACIGIILVIIYSIETSFNSIDASEKYPSSKIENFTSNLSKIQFLIYEYYKNLNAIQNHYHDKWFV